MKLRRAAGHVGFALAIFALISPALLVFLWMLSLSLKNEVDNMAFPPVFIPSPPTLANFVDVFAKNDFLSYGLNSVIVSFSATGIAILLGVPAGFGIAKTRATKAAALIMIARVTPGLSYLIPLFLIFQWLELTGTLAPLVITHVVITLPIVVWVMIGFFEGLPGELEEAALVDGATIWQAFRHVALPLARPGITVATILAFIFSWNNFIFGVVLAGPHHPNAAGRRLQRADLRTGQLGTTCRRGPSRDRAGAAPHPADAEGDRRWPDRRRRQGRLRLAGPLPAQSGRESRGDSAVGGLAGRSLVDGRNRLLRRALGVGHDTTQIAQERRALQCPLDQHAAAVHRVDLAAGQIEFAEPVERPGDGRLGHVEVCREPADRVGAVLEVAGQEHAELPRRQVGPVAPNQCHHGVAEDSNEMVGGWSRCHLNNPFTL